MGSLMKNLKCRQAKDAARQQAREYILDQYELLCDNIDISIAYTLHRYFGFGKRRLKRFFRKWVENQKQVIREYRYENDDCHYYAMDYELRNYYGIDVKAITKGVEAEMEAEEAAENAEG